MSSVLGWRVFPSTGIATQMLGPLADLGMVAELRGSRWQMSEKCHLAGTEEVVLRASDSSRFSRVSNS